MVQEIEEARQSLYKEAIKCLQSSFSSVPAQSSATSHESYTKITLYLKSMELILRNFSGRDLAKAKKKLTDVKFDLEMDLVHGQELKIYRLTTS